MLGFVSDGKVWRVNAKNTTHSHRRQPTHPQAKIVILKNVLFMLLNINSISLF